MLNKLLLPLLTLFIIWLGYTTYVLIQEDRCLNQEEKGWHGEAPLTNLTTPTKRLLFYSHEQKPYHLRQDSMPVRVRSSQHRDLLVACLATQNGD